MKHRTLVFAALSAVAALAGTAAAEPMRDADRIHDFHSVDRLTPATTFGVAIGYEVWDDNPLIDQVLGFDLSGHFVSQSGVGGYLVLPITYVSTKDSFLTEGGSETMIGNVELGGLYARKLGKRADFAVHIGVALPTADDDNGAISLAQPYASVPRFGDLVQRWPNSTWLRLGFSPMGSYGPFFWRADVGIDLMIDDDDGLALGLSPVLRLNAAAGVDLGVADVTAELVNNLTDPDNETSDELIHSLALGTRFDGGSVQPGVALILPFIDNLDELEFAIALSLTARMP